MALFLVLHHSSCRQLKSPALVHHLGHEQAQIPRAYRQPTPIRALRLLSAFKALGNPTKTCTSTSSKPIIQATNFVNPSSIATPSYLHLHNLSTAMTPHRPPSRGPPTAPTTLQLPTPPPAKHPVRKNPPVPTIGATPKAPPPSTTPHPGSSASTVTRTRPPGPLGTLTT